MEEAEADIKVVEDIVNLVEAIAEVEEPGT